MCLVEDQQINLIHPHIRIQKALVKNFCRAYNHYVCVEVLVPGLLAPQVCSHGTEELSNILVDVVAQHSTLLVYECYAVDLDDFSYPRPHIMVSSPYQKE